MPPWWTSITGSFGSWLVNPGLFAAGALLVSVPIIIHLLNRRKFKIVDWAAMDFLLEADKKNRRRVRLENLLLLLLRCLAIFLLALLLARPFDSSGLASRVFQVRQFERIILIDDSLSMKARTGNRSAMDVARERVAELVRTFVADRAENSLTVVLTSNPAAFKLNAVPLGSENADDLLAELEGIEAGDQPAKLTAALQAIDTYIETQPANIKRLVYVLTDLRRVDWQPDVETPKSSEATTEVAAKNAAAPAQPLELLRSISKRETSCFVIDVAENEDRNLLIKSITPEKTLVAGVESRIDVEIANPSSQDANNIKVRLLSGDAVPVVQEIEKLPAGETDTVRFAFTFQVDEENDDANTWSLPVKLEIQSDRGAEEDRLVEDSAGYVAAQVIRGIPTLLVDGDPSASFGKAESFYLRRSLRPSGKQISGVAPEVVTDTELDTVDLSKFQVIFLCNVYRLGEKPLEELKKWVAAGGGLVILPGEQVDEEYFNETLYGSGEREGLELSPVRLNTIVGDETEREWVNFRIDDQQHPVLKDFAGQQNPILANVKIFRWWKLVPTSVAGAVPPQVLAKLSDSEDSPALVERPYGAGRVIVAAIPGDADWTSWTSDPSYLLIMQELVRYLSPGDARDSMVRVGEPLRRPLDLTRYEIDAELDQPGERKSHLQATPIANTDDKKWRLEWKAAEQQGFYQLKLAKREGGTDSVLFAANVDPREGNLQRANSTEMQRELRDTGIQFLSAVGADARDAAGHVEIWKYLLAIVTVVLLGEQLLAWLFGLRR